MIHGGKQAVNEPCLTHARVRHDQRPPNIESGAFIGKHAQSAMREMDLSQIIDERHGILPVDPPKTWMSTRKAAPTRSLPQAAERISVFSTIS